jgi:mRNA interferase RelE/StbE
VPVPPYQVVVLDRVAKAIDALHPEARQRIRSKLAALAGNPRPPGVVRLTGLEDAYRIRVGDYRIVYAIRDQELLVLIIRVGHRREVYD